MSKAKPYVTLRINKCGECPHRQVGPSYSLDGFDRGEDWSCSLAKKTIAEFVEWRESDQPKTIPGWCPLRKAPKQ